MLDTRIIGRNKQIAFTDFFKTDGSFDLVAFAEASSDPDRKMIGDTQLNWLSNKINNSSKWQVIGQQVLMAKMFLPLELLIKLQASPEVEVLQKTLTELTTIKQRMQANDPTLTPQEKARVTVVVPYNLDAWDGYAVERELLLDLFSDKKVITLAGDTHNAWYTNVKNDDANKVAIELATPSVSSSGFESILGLTTPQAIKKFQTALETLIDDLIYTDTSQRGFLSITFTQSEAIASWNFIDTLLSKRYNLKTDRVEVIS